MSDPAQTPIGQPTRVEVRGPNPWLVLMVLGLASLVVGIWLILAGTCRNPWSSCCWQ